MGRPIDLHAAPELQSKHREELWLGPPAPQAPALGASIHGELCRLRIGPAPVVGFTECPQLGNERTEDLPWEVRVGRPAVDDGDAEGCRTCCDGLAAERHALREDEVVLRRMHACPLSAIVQARITMAAMALDLHPIVDVVRAVVAAHCEPATPCGKANGEYRGVHMLLIPEQVLQERRAAAIGTETLVGRSKSHDAVCPLGIEELVLLLVAA
mmetsp:Transcript_91006/g.253349  ORF Transcript_91006/g.253349 Transcript_91006/m.253349 type:complete len:213 (-) Transcript_91006:565-1203(-)